MLADDWNTIHVNDYQNWLFELDIMRDFSEGKIASIVLAKENPQLNYVLMRPTSSTGENTTTVKSTGTSGTGTSGIEITNPHGAFTEQLK
ncbi:hypothetical protein RclHR1_00070006 [Rhizophagus clarus]|uniref:Uncharacterized protein n=1 Tax=Rhizophagus clarus TaxID=94130 RepID=A0A2Z6SK83_9GLOM|nr:hypothetical protein RclHR1_00070006 [Rhizophagus clarus]